MSELTQKQQYWQAHLDALSGFEGTAVEYAKLHDLDARRLYDYKSRMARQPSPERTAPTFVRVERSTPVLPTVPAAGVAVLLPNGVRLNLSSVDEAMLTQLSRL